MQIEISFISNPLWFSSIQSVPLHSAITYLRSDCSLKSTRHSKVRLVLAHSIVVLAEQQFLFELTLPKRKVARFCRVTYTALL